jgi:hypothetical protein
LLRYCRCCCSHRYFCFSAQVLSLLKNIKEGTAELPPIATSIADDEEDLEFIYGDLMDLEDVEEEEEEEDDDLQTRAESKALSDSVVAQFLGGGGVRVTEDISMMESNKPSRIAKGGKRRGGGMRKKLGR